MIPLFVDCSGRRIVIFGGGEVAARKAGYFSGRADILVVSRSFSATLSGYPVENKVLDVSNEDDAALIRIIDGAFLVIAALSDAEQNNRIGRLSRERGILFNNADGEPGDVIFIAAGEKHWHGATKESTFSHIYVMAPDQKTTQLEP